MARTKRDAAGLLAALRDQRELLDNASKSYDGGSHAEAKNLATRLRVLLHDHGRNSRSVLAQLGVKERLPYLDTSHAEPPPGVIVMGGGLCMISAHLAPGDAGFSRYAPPLGDLSPDRQHPPQAFVDWWTDPVVADDHGRPISRRQFVLWLAEQDGGAHVDPSVDESYAELSTTGVSTFSPPESQDPRFRDLVAPSVRQIAYELQVTLDSHLFEDSGSASGVAVRDPICSLSIHAPPDVGRNDPCPCESGLKRKKCFGLRESRRRMSLADLEAELESGSPPP
jgi:hypothetical protein